MSKETAEEELDPDNPPPLTGSGISSWSTWTHYPSTPELSEVEVTAKAEKPAGAQAESQEQRKLSSSNEKAKPPEKKSVDMEGQSPKARKPTIEETQGDSAFSRELCSQGGACAKPIITLGEPEKEQLQSVGRHLLKIGRQLLDEMDFVEGLLGKFGSLGFESLKKDLKEKHVSCEGTTCGLQPTAQDNSAVVKEQLIDAITAQAKRLTWIEHATQEYHHATKAAQFGSAFATPVHSKCVSGRTGSLYSFNSDSTDEAKRVQDLLNQELKKRLAVAEAKLEKMNDALEACEKQICDMYSRMKDGMNKMAEDSAAMREQVRQDIAQSDQAREAAACKVSYLEAQIIHLAQIVWDLKCETRAQMHFGTY